MILPKSSLIVSCQAPIYSPLFEPKIIAAMAKASINQGSSSACGTAATPHCTGNERIPSAFNPMAAISASVVEREVAFCLLQIHASGNHALGPIRIRIPPDIDSVV